MENASAGRSTKRKRMLNIREGGLLYVNWDVSFLRRVSGKPWEEYIGSRTRGKGRNGSREIHDRLRDALFIRRKYPVAFSLAGSRGCINSDRNARNERRMATTDARKSSRGC